MNNRLFVFIAASVIVHIILFLFINFPSQVAVPKKKNRDVVDVRLIKKKKTDKTDVKPDKDTKLADRDIKRDGGKGKDKEEGGMKVLPQKAPKPVPPRKTVEKPRKEVKKQVGQKNQSPKKYPKKGVSRKNVNRPEKKSVDPQRLVLPKTSPRPKLKELTDEELFNKLTKDKVDLRDVYSYKKKAGVEEEEFSLNAIKFKYASYFYKFRRNLYGVWRYPQSARRRGEEGAAQVKFIIHRDGSITDIELVSSTGSPDLDREVLRALRKMGKVPLPSSYKGKYMKINGSFRYIINRDFQIY